MLPGVRSGGKKEKQSLEEEPKPALRLDSLAHSSCANAAGLGCGQVITDHFALGTPEAMYQYAAQPPPFMQSYGEGYVWRNLEQR